MDRVVTGLDAEQIRESTVYKNAREGVKKAIHNSIRDLPIDGKPETDRKRDLYFCMLKCVDFIDKQMVVAMASGRVEEKKIRDFGEKKKFGVL